MLYPPFGLQLIWWQKKVLRDLYGTLNMATGARQYEHGYISVAKQNGKTFLLGGLPIYHLVAEELEQPEVYGCASAKDQAGLVYKTCANLVNKNPLLLSRLKPLESTKRIIRRADNAFYAVLSADGGVQDGIRPSLLLKDELHRWKSALCQTLFDVTQKGQKSRKESLDLAITTAGAEYESPLWWNEYSYAKQVQSGAIQDPTYYVAIWEPDLKKIEADPEYWKSREARVASNPSHEDLGGFLEDSKITGDLQRAILQPAKKSAFVRYQLNCPVKQEEDPVVDMARWQACPANGVDLREWPGYDEDLLQLLIGKWNLLEKPCWAGVDASWSIDFTSVNFVFPPYPEDGHGPGCEQWTLLPFFWVPEAKVHDLQRICRIPLDSWVEQKFVAATPGSVIDQREVMNRIRWAREMFNLQEVPYDRQNFRSEALNLTDEGFVCPEVAQTFMGIGAATKFFLAQYLDGGIRHGNNPVLNWMASCLQVQHDKKDNVQPSKPERGKSTKRIDGVQAAVTALSRAIVAPAVSNAVIEVW